MRALRLDARLAKLAERIPKPPPPAPPVPGHPERAAFLFATTACWMTRTDFGTIGVDKGYPPEQAGCIAFWSEPHEFPKGVFHRPFTDLATATRMAELAWQVIPNIVAGQQRLAEYRDWYLATHRGDCPRDEDGIRRDWLQYYGRRALEPALTDAMVDLLEGRPVTDPDVSELARLVMKVSAPVRLDGQRMREAR